MRDRRIRAPSTANRASRTRRRHTGQPRLRPRAVRCPSTGPTRSAARRAQVSAIELFGTSFQNPILLAAGTAGFGRELDDVIDLDLLGGIVTKAVTPEPRQGHPALRVAEFRGGMLNAVGLANPGVE